MIAIYGYLMIASFLYLVIRKHMSVFAGMILVSVVFGLAAALTMGNSIDDLFNWFRSGLFYSVNDAGKVSLGTINPAIMILFAVMYFTLMMNVGLFDPLCTFLIRKAKGDPLKILMVTVLTTTVVTLDGDGTTTILIITSAFVPLYKRMNMKLSNLAMMIILPTGLGNCLPWGGPLVRAASVLDVEVNVLFVQILPILAVSLIYVFALAYWMGLKERKRLGYDAKAVNTIDHAQIEEMVNVILDNDKELKRPRLFLINLALTVVTLLAILLGYISGALGFTLATAAALAINYSAADQRERITATGGEAIAVTSIILAAGFFLGVLSNSGMNTAIADSLASIIPESFGGHMGLVFAFVGAIACYALPIDAYYFGILPVFAPIAQQYGLTPTEIGMASFMGQAIRYGSPTVAWLYLLMDRTEMSFAEYQKQFFKYSLPMFAIFIIVAVVTGVLPV
ncbi:citrate:proton symporter [Paracoccus laeviglucosivorans]|uniref:Citrate-Mg2+:H+ or citrate-Ca2+:H+ symporter, CitMHS family n=1 Tax=Paracoccus laeviglucosivorans TaxID=1197861 RepID=A0A521EQE8_9RHOB|nr:citrate:proton symporter [Paracoccus laeviglucosivorans]SMO85330.1 citrate-Mg2+:H+ or citrate-Ca2+:H+ symporter, CitMHS family [Paracoccus laeviglucosivorans]